MALHPDVKLMETLRRTGRVSIEYTLDFTKYTSTTRKIMVEALQQGYYVGGMGTRLRLYKMLVRRLGVAGMAVNKGRTTWTPDSFFNVWVHCMPNKLIHQFREKQTVDRVAVKIGGGEYSMRAFVEPSSPYFYYQSVGMHDPTIFTSWAKVYASTPEYQARVAQLIQVLKEKGTWTFNRTKDNP